MSSLDAHHIIPSINITQPPEVGHKYLHSKETKTEILVNDKKKKKRM